MIMNGTCHLLYLNQVVISVHGVFSRCLVVPLSCERDLKVGSPQKPFGLKPILFNSSIGETYRYHFEEPKGRKRILKHG